MIPSVGEERHDAINAAFDTESGRMGPSCHGTPRIRCRLAVRCSLTMATATARAAGANCSRSTFSTGRRRSTGMRPIFGSSFRIRSRGRWSSRQRRTTSASIARRPGDSSAASSPDRRLQCVCARGLSIVLVLARVEWLPPDFQNAVVHRGVTLYEPAAN